MSVVPVTVPDMTTRIDCDTCVVRGLHCHDCVVTVLLGPPLVKWTIDAVNEAGSTKKDEPTAPAEQPAADTGADPQATPSAGQKAIDDAKALTSPTTPPVAAP